jgi:hypothetical protein
MDKGFLPALFKKFDGQGQDESDEIVDVILNGGRSKQVIPAHG